MKEMYQQDIDAIPGERGSRRKVTLRVICLNIGEIGVSVLK